MQLGHQGGAIVAISRNRDFVLGEVTSFAPIGADSEGDGQGVMGISLKDVTKFGRAAGNDVALDSLLASPFHAHVVRDGSRVTIVDLASARGTYVKGGRVQSWNLTPGDTVTMGGQSFRFEASGEMRKISAASGIRMEVRGLSVRAGHLTLLNDINLAVLPRSLVAVVGPSGSGKSTLLGAMTGLRPAEAGNVVMDGQDLYSAYGDWRFRIGFVPQQDLVPPQLTIRQALDYAARLRFPPETLEQERAHRIDEVLAELRLRPQEDTRIDKLSGGQRKRVSVALELLTKPPVLFLDEPTSGLDPGLDQQLMMVLRELADDGRTVLVVTHAMDNLFLCDRVLVLAAGGFVAYYGPPGDAPEYFGASDWPGLFLALETRPGREWARAYQDWSLSEGLRHLANADAGPGNRAPIQPIARAESGWRQLPTLVARTWRVTVSDRAYAALIVALPVVLAALGFLVGSPLGLGPGDPPTGLNPDARILLLILVLGAAFTGCATSIQELVKERVIYRRERAVGLSRSAYVTSKALVFGAIACLQGAVFAGLTLVGRPGPEYALLFGWSVGEVVLIIALLAGTSCTLGLALSAVLPTRESILPALVIVTMVQTVLSGAIPLRWPSFDDVLGLANPAAWAFKALAGMSDLDELLGPGTDQDWPSTTGVVWQSIAAMGALSTAFICTAIVLQRTADPGRR
jgi:ABC-type multidrug transport system ATPase subunit